MTNLFWLFLKLHKSLTSSCWIPPQVILTFLYAADLFGSGSGQTLLLPPPHWQRAWQSRVAFWQSRGGFAINLSARSPLGAVHTPRVLDPPLSVATVLPPSHRQPLPLSKYRWEPRAARDLGFHDPSSTGLRFSPGGRWTDHLLLLLWLGLIFTSRKSGRSKKEILFGSRNGIQLAAFLSFSSLQLKMSQQ